MRTVGQGSRRRPVGLAVVGVGLLVAGVLLLLDQLGVADTTAVVADWWPVVVVGLGLGQLYERRWGSGAVTVVVGLVLLAWTSDVADVNPIALLGPVLLIVIGGAVLVASGRVVSGGEVGPVAVFGSGRLEGGPAEVADRTTYAVFGDVDVTLTGDGTDDIGLSTITVFGDTKVHVPPGWRIDNRTVTLFGDSKAPGVPGPETGPTIELTGLVLFGDLKIFQR